MRGGKPGRDDSVFHDLGIAALLAATVLFVSAMGLLGANISQLRDSYARVQSSDTALQELSDVHTQVLQIEMTIRGYLLSGDRDFLAWGEKNHENLSRSMKDLNAMFAHDPVQAAHLEKLHAVMREYQAKFASVTDLPRDQAVATVIRIARSNPRAPLVQVLDTMQRAEKERLAQRLRNATDNVRNAAMLAFGIIVLAVVAGGLGLAWTLRWVPFAKAG